jgi:hypothetical protein
MRYFGRLADRREETPNYTALFNTLQTYQQTLIIPKPVLYNGVNLQLERYRTPHIDLKTGDRITIFNSITAGKTLWKGELSFFQHHDAPYQIGIDPVIWSALHIGSFPARLTKVKTGEIIDGTLLDSIERPKDYFHLHDFKNNSYDSIHGYQEGDTLEIFSSITEGNVLWQGEIKTYSKPVATGFKSITRTKDNKPDHVNLVDEYKGNKLKAPTEKEMTDYRMRSYPAMLERG